MHFLLHHRHLSSQKKKDRVTETESTCSLTIFLNVLMLLFLYLLLNLCCGRRECECACVGGYKRKVMGLELICPGLVPVLFQIHPPTSCVPAWNACLFSQQMRPVTQHIAALSHRSQRGHFRTGPNDKSRRFTSAISLSIGDFMPSFLEQS